MHNACQIKKLLAACEEGMQFKVQLGVFPQRMYLNGGEFLTERSVMYWGKATIVLGKLRNYYFYIFYAIIILMP